MLCGNISVYIFTKLCYPENLLAAHAWLTHSGMERQHPRVTIDEFPSKIKAWRLYTAVWQQKYIIQTLKWLKSFVKLFSNLYPYINMSSLHHWSQSKSASINQNHKLVIIYVKKKRKWHQTENNQHHHSFLISKAFCQHNPIKTQR